MKFLAVLVLFAAAASAQKPCRFRLDGHPEAICSIPSAAAAVVSHETPFAEGCNGNQTGTNYRNAPAEPWVSIDPKNPLHLVGAWQQDRWDNGGSSGLVNGVSFDGGRTWTTSFAPFSVCSGGNFQRASDPWISVAPDGTAHQISLSLSGTGTTPNTISSILVSRSFDGGLTWSTPTALIADAQTAFNDKESITADPYDSNLVYATWDRALGSTSNRTYRQPAWFSRTADGGKTWEQPRIIYDPGVNADTIGNQIVVLPDGALIDLFTAGSNLGTSNMRLSIRIVRSQDKGLSWSDPIVVSDLQVNGVANLKTKSQIRTGAALPSIAVDPVSGAIYVAWQDSRFSGNLRDGIVMSRSIDGGKSWSGPVQVNQAPTVQAFQPAIAVARDGTVALDYFDFRKDTEDPNYLWTSSWRVVSHDRGETWEEFPLLPPFDLNNAPPLAGYFIGDYHAIVPTPDGFLSFFVIANPAGSAERNSVIAVASVQRGDTSTTAREQIHLNRYQPKIREARPPKRR